MRRKALFGSLFVALAMLSAAYAQQAVPQVKEIRLNNVGHGPLDKDFVLAHVSLKQGDDYNALIVASDLKKLLGSGRFSAVNIMAEKVGPDVILIYQIRNKLKLGERVTVTGVDHLDEEDVRDLLEIFPGDLFDEQTVGVGARAVIEGYREDYYPEATIDWVITVLDENAGLGKVEIDIEEGVGARLKHIVFEGNEHISSRKLKKLVSRLHWFSFIAKTRGIRYDQKMLRDGQDVVRGLYGRKGFLDAKVGEPVLDKDEDGRMRVKYSITEGPQYRFGETRLDGITALPEKEIKNLVRIKEGDIASSADVQRTVRMIKDFYGNKGYIQAVAAPVLMPRDGAPVVDVVLRIREGRQVFIRNILIKGNYKTRDKVVRREVFVFPGEALSSVNVRRSQRKLMNLGYFSEVNPRIVATVDAAQADLVFEVEEQRTGNLMLGGGYSSGDGFTGFFELSQNNFDIAGWPYFTGGGQVLKLKTSFGTTRRDYELAFREPHFADSPMSLGFSVFGRERNLHDYDTKKLGGSLSFGRALGRFSRADLTYSLVKTDITDVSDTNEYLVVVEQEPWYDVNQPFFFMYEKELKSTVQLALVYDTRNSPFWPSRGVRLTCFGALSGGALGADTDMVRVGGRASGYIPLWRGHILSLRLAGQVVDEFGDTESIPIYDKLYAGGGSTIRGFDKREVGPKCVRVFDDGSDLLVLGHKPMGGRSRLLSSAEYLVPLNRQVKLSAFIDAGGVWADAYEFEFDSIASGAGLGIRFDVMPGLPLRLDYTWPIERDSELTDTERFEFWFGKGF